MRMRLNFVSKPFLQFKFIAYFAVVVIVTVGSLYYVVERALVKTLIDIGISQTEITASLTHMRMSTLVIIVIIIVALAFLGFIYFHSFTGPIFSLERSLDSLKTGDLTTRISIRKSDELKELTEKLKAMVDNIKNMIAKDRQQAQEISKGLENIIKNSKLPQEQLGELSNLQQKASAITQEFTI